MSTRTYEAFLPHHTASKHRVMAIVDDTGGHTHVQAIATVSDALTACRLADALNSQLLDRPNHANRLDAALTGLPDSVRAAVTQLTIDPKHAHTGRTPLATHLRTDPIDGILLFPTTRCTADQCTVCTDCTNDCHNCPLCEDHQCDDCVAPDLTPRTAYALTVAGSVLADQCYDAIDEDTPSTPTERREPLPLPPALHAQNDDFIRQMARCFDDLTNDLDNGEWPQPHNLAEQLALHLMIDDAAEAQDTDDLGTPEQLLPQSRFDNDFDSLYHVLFDDTDHTGLLQPQTPHPPGQLDYLFEDFHNMEDRDPHRGYRC
jgi:hypothetical protein